MKTVRGVEIRNDTLACTSIHINTYTADIDCTVSVNMSDIITPPGQCQKCSMQEIITNSASINTRQSINALVSHHLMRYTAVSHPFQAHYRLNTACDCHSTLDLQ